MSDAEETASHLVTDNAEIKFQKDQVAQLRADLAELRAELENERMRLAACGVAALSNTDKTIKTRIDKDSPYYSASYQDVCSAVDREMQLRAEIVELRARLKAP